MCMRVESGQQTSAEGALQGRTPAPVSAPASAALTQARYAVRLMRPMQWSKNGLVLLAIVFARQLTNLPVVGRGLLAFGAFCFASSAVYVFNDILDREQD